MSKKQAKKRKMDFEQVEALSGSFFSKLWAVFSDDIVSGSTVWIMYINDASASPVDALKVYVFP